MILKEVSASVNPRSHCLVACQTKPLIVYASQLQLAVQTVPKTEKEVGVISRLSERRHNKPISCLIRVKSKNSDEFATGGDDSEIILWKLNEETECVEFVKNLESCSGSIGSICGTKTTSQTTLIAASFSSNDLSKIRCWWSLPGTLSTKRFDIYLKKTVVALCLDAVEFENTVLLAAGTSKRFVELYGEADDRKSFRKLISVAGHIGSIFSIAFNDNPSNLLLASAGQDTFVRLWSIDNESSAANIGKNEEEELTSVKNAFKIGDIPMKISSYAVMQGHDDWVHSTSWNSDGTILMTASSDKTCIIWRNNGNRWIEENRLEKLSGDESGFSAAVFHDFDHLITSSSFDRKLYAWRSEKIWNQITMVGGLSENRNEFSIQMDYSSGKNESHKSDLRMSGDEQDNQIVVRLEHLERTIRKMEDTTKNGMFMSALNFLKRWEGSAGVKDFAFTIAIMTCGVVFIHIYYGHKWTDSFIKFFAIVSETFASSYLITAPFISAVLYCISCARWFLP